MAYKGAVPVGVPSRRAAAAANRMSFIRILGRETQSAALGRRRKSNRVGAWRWSRGGFDALPRGGGLRIGRWRCRISTAVEGAIYEYSRSCLNGAAHKIGQ